MLAYAQVRAVRGKSVANAFEIFFVALNNFHFVAAYRSILSPVHGLPSVGGILKENTVNLSREGSLVRCYRAYSLKRARYKREIM